jgi:hypothetical protein
MELIFKHFREVLCFLMVSGYLTAIFSGKIEADLMRDFFVLVSMAVTFYFSNKSTLDK